MYETWFTEYAQYVSAEHNYYQTLVNNFRLPYGDLLYGFTIPDPTPEGFKRVPADFRTGKFDDFYLPNAGSPGVAIRFNDYAGSGYDYRPVNFAGVPKIKDKRDWADALLEGIITRGNAGQNPLLSGGSWMVNVQEDTSNSAYASLRPSHANPAYQDPPNEKLQWTPPPPDTSAFSGMLDNQLFWMSGDDKPTATMLVMLNPQIPWELISNSTTGLTTAFIQKFDSSLCQDSPPRYDGHVIFVSEWLPDFTAKHQTLSYTKKTPETTSAIDICRSYTSIGYPPSPPRAPEANVEPSALRE